jgi:autotransporter-associated beta strand protein
MSEMSYAPPCHKSVCGIVFAALAAIHTCSRSANAANTENDLTSSNNTASLLNAINWSLGHVPLVNEDATYTGTTTGIRQVNTGSFSVGSFNVTGNSGTFSVRDESTASANRALTLGGSGNLGNSVSGNSADLVYVATGATFNIRGDNPNGFGGLRVVLGQSGNFNAAGTLTISSVISDGGAGFGVTKTGTGLAAFSGANTYTGATIINAGTLRAGVGSFVSVGSAITVNAGGTLLLNGIGRHIGSAVGVNLNGGIFNTGGLSEPGGTVDGTNFIGALTLNASSTLDFGAGSSSVLEFAGANHVSGSSVLNIINWDGIPGIGGSGDRLLFNGLVTDFTGKYAQNDVTFDGVTGYTAIQIATGLNPFYEIVGIVVPETDTYAAGMLMLGILLVRRK